MKLMRRKYRGSHMFIFLCYGHHIFLININFIVELYFFIFFCHWPIYLIKENIFPLSWNHMISNCKINLNSQGHLCRNNMDCFHNFLMNIFKDIVLGTGFIKRMPFVFCSCSWHLCRNNMDCLHNFLMNIFKDIVLGTGLFFTSYDSFQFSIMLDNYIIKLKICSFSERETQEVRKYQTPIICTRSWRCTWARLGENKPTAIRITAGVEEIQLQWDGLEVVPLKQGS